jgi:hypothetical protein
LKLLPGLLVLFALLPVVQTQPADKPLLNAASTQLSLRGRTLLDADKDGFMSIKEIVYAPNNEHFAVIACGYECNDNRGFLFRRDGGGKRQFTARWDFIQQSALEWSEDGRTLFYHRINSSGAAAPRKAPPPGWIQVDVKSGSKAPATTRKLKTTASYAVFNLRGDDQLNLRAAPRLKAKIAGRLPHNATGVKVTGASVKSGGVTWAPVQMGRLAGWVNQNYLCEERKP